MSHSARAVLGYLDGPEYLCVAMDCPVSGWNSCQREMGLQWVLGAALTHFPWVTLWALSPGLWFTPKPDLFQQVPGTHTVSLCEVDKNVLGWGRNYRRGPLGWSNNRKALFLALSTTMVVSGTQGSLPQEVVLPTIQFHMNAGPFGIPAASSSLFCPQCLSSLSISSLGIS